MIGPGCILRGSALRDSRRRASAFFIAKNGGRRPPTRLRMTARGDDGRAAGRSMDFIQAINPLYSVSGFAVGVLVGMTGVGGGSLMTPLLILLFGIHPATAVGTDLLYAAATKSSGSLVHGFARSIDWRVVRRLATGSLPATVITLGVLSYFDLSSEAS